VYHRQDGGGTIIIILYVDDITLLGDSVKEIKGIKFILSKHYEMTDLGEIDSYLGVRITRDRSIRRLEIDQSRYISEILDCFSMADANPAQTPLPAGAEVHLVKYDGEATNREIKEYQQLIGSLLYVQIGTRPDVSFAVSRLAQYASNPSAQHMRLAKYVLAYLKGTADLRLRFDGDGEGLHGYSDSSLGDQVDDFHSTMGYVFLLANAAISWSSRKQKTVAQSTTQAEYMALADAANQAAWYRSFLTELGYEITDPIPLHGDNKGAVDLALNPMTGKRSKHIAIKHHAIREYVEDGNVVAAIIDSTLSPGAAGRTIGIPVTNITFAGFFEMTSWTAGSAIKRYDVVLPRDTEWYKIWLDIDIPAIQESLITSACDIHQAFCAGDPALIQYSNYNQCKNFLKFINFGTYEEGYGNTVTCRLYHAPMATVRPDIHCAHIGHPDNPANMYCRDHQYEDLWTLVPAVHDNMYNRTQPAAPSSYTP